MAALRGAVLVALVLIAHAAPHGHVSHPKKVASHAPKDLEEASDEDGEITRVKMTGDYSRSAKDNRRAAMAAAAGAGVGALFGAVGDEGSGDMRWKAGAGAVAGLAANEAMRLVERFSTSGAKSIREDDRPGQDLPDEEDSEQRLKKDEDCDHGVVAWKSHDMRLEYMTNIEGQWAAFMEYVDQSPNLWMDDEETVLMDSNTIFVFGGDVCDRGTGDIRIVKSLLDLKRRNPGRVFWVLGERDINKLRLFSELDENEKGRPIDVYWEPEYTPIRRYCELEKDDPIDRMCRLEWTLAEAMDAPDAVHYRKQELLELQGLSDTKAVIEAKHVLGSFRDQVNPTHTAKDPFMLEYIRKGYLALIVGDALFVHGAVRRGQLGFIPGARRARRAVEWVKDLNKWKDDQLMEFANQPTWVKDDGTAGHGNTRGGEMLFDYALPRGGAGRSIVTSDWLDATGNRGDIKDEVAEWLVKDGINRVLSGHTPMGVSPGVIRHKAGLVVVIGDISFARDRNYFNRRPQPRLRSGSTNRGLYKERLIRAESGSVRLFTMITLSRDETVFEGVLPGDICGTPYESEYCVHRTDAGHLFDGARKYRVAINRWETADKALDLLVGRKLLSTALPDTNEGSWWITAVIRPPEGNTDKTLEPMYLLSKLEFNPHASKRADVYKQHYQLVKAKTDYDSLIGNLDPNYSVDLPIM